MVSGSLHVWVVMLFALMLLPLSGCIGTGPDSEEATSAPVVQEEADDDADEEEDPTTTRGADPAPAPGGTVPTDVRPTPTDTVQTTLTADDRPAPTIGATDSSTTPSAAERTTGPSSDDDQTPAATTRTPVPSASTPPTQSASPAATATPTATPEGAPVTAEDEEEDEESGEWPREGSFVRYRTTGGGSSPGGGFATSHEADWHLVYTDGTWEGDCTWSRSERVRQYDSENDTYEDTWTNTSGRERVTATPPRGFTDVVIGDVVEVPYLAACQEELFEALTVERRTVHSAPRQSDGSPSWYGYWDPEWPADAYAYWETESGLVLAWRDQRTNGYDDGWMVDTDAPLT